MEERVYEVTEWDESSFLKSHGIIRFKNKEDMKEARISIMNDRDIVFKVVKKGKTSVYHIPYGLLKQELYEGKIIFEAGGN